MTGQCEATQDKVLARCPNKGKPYKIHWRLFASGSRFFCQRHAKDAK